MKIIYYKFVRVFVIVFQVKAAYESMNGFIKILLNFFNDIIYAGMGASAYYR